jgi:hypothetical protein
MAAAPDVCGAVLRQNFTTLKNNINLKRSTLFDRLIDAKLINEREKQTVEGKVEMFEKAGELVDVILQKGDDAIHKFLEALRVTHPTIYTDIRRQILVEDPTHDLPEGLTSYYPVSISSKHVLCSF